MSETTDRVDVKELMAEIEAEVDRKRAAGLYPPDVTAEIDESAAHAAAGGGGAGGPRTDDNAVTAALIDLHRSSHVTGLISTASHKPVIAPLITFGRRTIRSASATCRPRKKNSGTCCRRRQAGRKASGSRPEERTLADAQAQPACCSTSRPRRS